MSNVRLWASEWDRTFVLAGRRIDPADRRIKTADAHSEIEPRVMAVLIALARRQGETVRRQDLIDLVWRGAPGADPSLSNAISLLRSALGDTDAENRLIQTIPKQGYRLTVPVERSALPDGKKLSPASTTGGDVADDASGGIFGARVMRRTVLAGAAFAVATLSVFLLLDRTELSNTSVGIENISEFEPRSIAVLPFVNMSSDIANDYFSDGMAEEILNALAQVDSLKVASRTDSFRFRGENASIEEISKRLKVANILEGSVRQEDNQLRVTVQLISASDGRHLWSSTYDRKAGDIFAIQQDIALNIANALVDELSDAERERVTSLPTKNLEAYDYFLIGNYQLRQWTIDDNRRALVSFKAAVELDPKFAEAHLGMGRAYYYAGTHYGWMTPAEAMPKVKASLVHGISSTNPVTRAAALSIYGDVLTWNDQDWRGALAAFQRAYEISGTPALGYALTNSIVGNHDAAIGILQKSIDSGDTDNGTRNNLAWAYFNARRYEDALREAEAVLLSDGTFADGYRVLGRAQLLLGEADAAINSFSKAVQLLEGAPLARSDLAVAYARTGRVTEARVILKEILNTDEYVPAPLIAQIYANLGESDAAFKWLEKGIDEGARGVIFLKINPLYDPQRNDPRFSGLLTRLNLAPNIRSPRN